LKNSKKNLPPQYGGYCAFGYSQGSEDVITEPDAFLVTDGSVPQLLIKNVGMG
jgi:hypothetical protein